MSAAAPARRAVSVAVGLVLSVLTACGGAPDVSARPGPDPTAESTGGLGLGGALLAEAGSPTPAPVSAAPPAAAAVATAFVRDSCPADWRQPYGLRERRAAVHLTPAAARRLAPGPSGRAAWTTDVVARRLVLTCRITSVEQLPAAPNSRSRSHLAVVVQRRAVRPGARPATDVAEYVLDVVLRGGLWKVDRVQDAG